MRRFMGVCALVLAVLSASPAAAEWRRAESERFIVYSQTNEGVLRAYVQKLERYDLFLRQRMGLSVNTPPLTKLQVFLVSGREGLQQVAPRISDGTIGVYFSTAEGIFAVAIRDSDDDTLLHEYAHHFMFQNLTRPYPAWLVEGFAEYFMTADIDADSIIIGGYNRNRVAWLQDVSWIPLPELLSSRPGEIRRGPHQNTYYPLAWLLTHWFMGDAGRSAKLETYIADIEAGGDPVEAMQRATGLTIPQLRAALREYFNGRIPQTRYTFDFAPASVTITTLPPSADDMLLIAQRLKIGVPQDRREATAAEVRRRASRHPGDPFAQLQLGHAELHFGDAEAGEGILTSLLESEPDNVEALQLLSTRYLSLAREEGEDRRARLVQARDLLARAFAADDADFRTFMLLGELRSGASTYPTENDLQAWSNAHALAPQLAQTTLGYAGALMLAGQAERAVSLLQPLANAPHGGPASEAATTMLDRARSNQAPLSEGEIDAAAQAEVEEEGEGEPVAPPAPTGPGETPPETPPA